MKRRILSCLLALIMTLSLLPMNALAADHYADIRVIPVYEDSSKPLGYDVDYSSNKYLSVRCQSAYCRGNINHSVKIADFHPDKMNWTIRSGYEWKGWIKYTQNLNLGNVTNPPFGTYYSWSRDQTNLVVSSMNEIYMVYGKKAPAQTTYSLTYDKNTTDTVTNMPDNQTTTVAADGVQFTVSPLIPVREGYTFKGWQTSDGTKVGPKVGVTKENPSITIYAIREKNETPPIDPPKPSGEPNFADVNGQIRVQRTAFPSNHEPHAYKYAITDGSYTKEGLSSDGFSYSITLDRASFIKKFDANTEYTHKDEEPDEVARVTWRWDVDANNEGKWVLISGPDGITADIKCICEATPELPDDDVVKKALGDVTVHCINPTTDTQNCTDKKYWAAGGNSVGKAVKVSDTQYTVSIGAAAFVNAFDRTGKHNLYSAETLTWVLNYEDGKWVGTPKEAGVDDTILVTHAPEKYQEVSMMGYDLDGNPTGIKATCTTSGHGPITYGLSTAFANYGTDVESVTYDAESKGYIATLKVTHYAESIGTGCNNERAKANLDARDHKLTSDETVQWKLYPTGYDKESGKYVWASMPVADKDAAITVSHKLAVTFDLNGGNVDGNTSNVVVPVAWGSTVTKPTTPSKSGYTFAGWYTEDHEVFDFNTAIYDNLTLTAAWAPAKAAAFVENFLTIDCVGCNLGSKLGHAHGAKTYEFLDRAFSVNKDTFQWNEELGTYTVELYNKSLKLNPYLDSIANWVGFEKDPGEGLPHQMVGGDRNFYLLCAQDENGQWKAVGYADWKQGGKHGEFTMMPNGVKIDVECGTPELPTLVTDSAMIYTRDETNTRNYLKTSVLDGTWTVLNDTFKRDEKTGAFYVTIQVAKDQLTKYIDNAAKSKKWGDGYLLNEEKTENENATPFQFVMKFNLDTSKDASEAYKSTYVKRNKTYSNWSWDKSTVSGSVKNNGYTVWATKEYNVTFETDGGKPVPAPQVVRWGKYATKPTEIPVKGDSWVFNGWYTDETGAVEFDFDKTAIKANTTIYAGYDSVYEIHYFKQLVDGSYEEDTASFVRGFAKEGTVINAPEKDYGTHFLLNKEKSNMSGPVIKATVDKENKVNCLVLNVYYDRDMHTVTFDTQGGTKIDPVMVRCGNPVAQPITPSKAGYYFSGWFLNGSKYNFSTPVTSDITITAEFTKYAPVNPVPPTVEAKDLAFNTTDHFAYVNGYPNGTVQPEGNITRAEVAAILYRVMDAKCVEKYATDKNTFADVDAFKWYNTYISTLANAGVIVDSANGYFRPDEAITRAELAAMIAQFAKVDLTKSVSFNDVLANHWASKEIAIAAKMGWINGYPDGSFRPDATITRAEMITMINRALNRVPSAEDHLLAGMVTFPDCQSGQWYYLAVQEATNGHTYNRVGTAGDEQWIALIK